MSPSLPSFDEMFTARDLEQTCDVSSATKITLNNESVTISKEGIYLITGSLSDGQIIIDVAKTDKVQLVLDNADITCSSSAAIYVKQADKVFITLAEGSKNTLHVSGDYVSSDVTEDDNVDGVIFSKDDIVFNGSGSLTIQADYGHGIVGKDDLKVTGGTYDITAARHGISANDSIRIADGTFYIDSEKDCFNSEDYIAVFDGAFELSSGDDAMHADGILMVYNGDIKVITCYEGLEGLSVTIYDGNIDITSDDDGINASDGSGAMGGGMNKPQGGRDFGQSGTADGNNTPPNGDMNFGYGKGPRDENGFPQGTPPDGAPTDTTSENQTNGTSGDTSSDPRGHGQGRPDRMPGGDGTDTTTGATPKGNASDNASNGQTEGTDTTTGATPKGNASNNEANGQTGDADTVTGSTQKENRFGGRPAGGAVNENCYIKIEGGTIRIATTGRDADAIDSNGNLIVTGGDLFICGTAPIDYDGTAQVSGGKIIAYGGANMAQNFGSDSAQPSYMTYLNGTASAGAKVNLKDSSGNVILSCTLEHDAQCIIISTPELKSGETYTLTVDDATYSLSK